MFEQLDGIGDALRGLPLEAYGAAIVASVALMVFVSLDRLDERRDTRSSLRSLDFGPPDGGVPVVEDTRQKDLMVPLYVRMFSPVLALLGRLGSRFNPPEYVANVRMKHVQAGIYTPERVERFLATRILLLALIPVWVGVMLAVNPLQLSGLWLFPLTGIVAAGMALLPNSQLNGKVEARAKAIQKQLPDVLDLMVISVEAGLGFEQAVARVVDNVPGEMSQELGRVMGETSAGSTRADALRAMQDRVDLQEIRSFVLALIQADRFGVSIGRVLRSQAEEMRIKRRQRAQERAQQAPVKMLIPMVFCIFPALFVVILGPAILNIAETLG